MLQPARRKYRKEQKGRNKGVATRGNNVSFGEFGLKAIGRGRLTARQISPRVSICPGAPGASMVRARPLSPMRRSTPVCGGWRCAFSARRPSPSTAAARTIAAGTIVPRLTVTPGTRRVAITDPITSAIVPPTPSTPKLGTFSSRISNARPKTMRRTPAVSTGTI